MSVYLDTAATTRVDERVAELVLRYMRDEFGNAGSRTHSMGAAAKRAVERAREQVAATVASDPSDVVFTSGATEADNLAILGLREHGDSTGRRHIVTTAIEHKAVLEPTDWLVSRGFDVTRVPASPSGQVSAADVLAAVRPDTLLVSMMHVNNETGVIQPIVEVASGLAEEVYLHVDAAQSFGKLNADLRSPRIDLISCSAHKVFGPKGVGALISRRRGRRRAPLAPLMFGGGQERGLRPGTQPVPLIVGFGEAARLAELESVSRGQACSDVGRHLERALRDIGAEINGTAPRIPHILNFSLPGLDSEAAILLLKDEACLSNGSACTSDKYEPSHVLAAMSLERARCLQAVRVSWSHTEAIGDVSSVIEPLKSWSLTMGR